MAEENIKIIMTEEQKKHFQQKNSNPLSIQKGTGNQQHLDNVNRLTARFNESQTSVEQKPLVISTPKPLTQELPIPKQSVNIKKDE
jgi:hypothetical protein